MIWHFVEVWLLLLTTFVIGCGLGAALYGGLGNSQLAVAQGRVADAIGDVIDSIKARLGLGPDWRDGFRVRVPVERPIPPPRPKRQRRVKAPAPPRDDFYDDRDYDDARYDTDYEADDAEILARAVANRARDREHDWEDDADYARRARQEHEAWQEDETDDVYPADTYEKERPEPLRAAADDAEEEEPAVESVVAKRPTALLSPRNGVPDHLQRIRGIGKGNEELLNSLGIFHFGQIAAWTPAEARWVAAQMPFPERIERDDWIGQATILASGGETGYVKAAERRRARRAAGETGNGQNGDTDD
jgi:predicted flap endonuclease-1-like 5' DNA nuclease